MRDPSTVPEKIKQRLKNVGLWDVDPVNLFRITWKNEPVERGGLYNKGNWIEFPSALTGVDARIIGLVGKFFPTGAHKVGAAFGCLVPKLVSRTIRSDAAQSGLAAAPATTAAAERSIRRSWAARPSRFCRRK